MRKKSRKSLIKQLDDLVSKYIIQRDGECVTCGSRESLTNSHVFSRSHQILRWDITDNGNCHAQCWPCNYRHVHNTYPYYNWYIGTYGKRKWNKLYQVWERTTNYKDWELLEMYERLKKTIGENIR